MFSTTHTKWHMPEPESPDAWDNYVTWALSALLDRDEYALSGDPVDEAIEIADRLYAARQERFGGDNPQPKGQGDE